MNNTNHRKLNMEDTKENEVSGKCKVLMVVTNHTKLGDTGKSTGWYLPEVAHPYYVFKKANVSVTFGSPLGGLARVDDSSVSGFDKDDECVNFLKEFVKNRKDDNPGELETVALSKVNSKDFNCVFYAGGHGTMWDFKDNKDINRISKEIYESGGIVSAVCHGPAALLGITLSNGEKLIKGKKVCGFTNDEEEAVKLTKQMPFLLETELKKCGGDYQKGENWKSCAVLSKRVVTGQNPNSAKKCAQLILSCYKS